MSVVPLSGVAERIQVQVLVLLQSSYTCRCKLCVRESTSTVEHPMRVHTELVYGHIADKPATGMSNFHRKCSPYPFSGEVAVQSPACDFYLRLQGFQNIYVYFTGEPTQKTTCKEDSMAGFKNYCTSSSFLAEERHALRLLGRCCLLHSHRVIRLWYSHSLANDTRGRGMPGHGICCVHKPARAPARAGSDVVVALQPVALNHAHGFCGMWLVNHCLSQKGLVT